MISATIRIPARGPRRRTRIAGAALAFCSALVVPLGSAVAQTADAPSASAPAFALPLEEGVRDTSVDQLQQILFDLSALQRNVHQAHWNVQGVEYYQLHEFYEELYEALTSFIDEAAERKLALAAPADGRPSAIAANARIEEIEPGYLSDEATLRSLTEKYSAMSGFLYEAVEAVGDDLVTQDLLIGFAYVIDKHFWQLRSHLALDADAAEAGGAN